MVWNPSLSAEGWTPGTILPPAYRPANLLPGVYTLASLPDPTLNAMMYAWVTDLFDGNADMCISDGTWWKPVRPLCAVSRAGNANMTLLALANAPTQILTGVLSAVRTITLGTQYAYRGARFRILRQASGLPAISIAGLASLSLNGWTDLEFDGSTWIQTGSGGLL